MGRTGLRVVGMTDDRLRKEALDYHSAKPAGKLTVVPTKPHGTSPRAISGIFAWGGVPMQGDRE